MDTRDIERRRKLLSGAIPFPEQGKGFLVNTGFDWLVREALESLGSDRLEVIERDLVTARRLTSAFPELSIAHVPRPEPQPGDTVIMPVGKQRFALQLEIRRLAERLGPEGRIMVYGTRSEGVLPAQKFLEAHCEVAPPLARAGGRLIIARPKENVTWELADPKASFFAEARGQRVEVATQPGVFSWEQLDDATALLLEHSSPRDGNRLLDLGCGTGIVSAILWAEGKIASVTLTDTDALALETATQTMRLNGIEAVVVPSDAGTDLPDRSCDLILCNPPLHQGFGADRETPTRIVEQAQRLLAAKGRLFLVGPPTISPGRIMESIFGTATQIAETPRFQVWLGIKRKHRRRPKDDDFRNSM